MKPSLHSVAGIITSGLSLNTTGSIPLRLVKPYTAARRFAVSKAEASLPLAEVLHRKFPFRSQIHWQERIDAGNLLVNGSVYAGKPLRENDQIIHISPETIEPSVPDLTECIQQEENWSIWFKPAPLPVHAGGRYEKNTFAAIVEEKTGKPALIVHRLDAVTTGLLIVAHTSDWAEKLSAAFRDLTVEKEYLAIVSGVPTEKSWVCDDPIRRKKGFVFETHRDGATAETQFRLLETDGEKSLISCVPITGRTHQIRLHLRASGFPIVDDPVYGKHIQDPSEVTLQNTAIALLNRKIIIPELGIEAKIL